MDTLKNIKGYEGLYKINSLGDIYSLDRTVFKIDGRVTKYKGKKLNPSIKNGYKYVNLSKEGKVKYKYIHQAMAEVFLNHKINKKTVVDHIDNNRLNNNLDNLQIITNRENTSKDKKNCSSKYTGVYWNKASKKWVSMIRIKGVKKYLGTYTSEYDVYKKYEKALLDLQSN